MKILDYIVLCLILGAILYMALDARETIRTNDTIGAMEKASNL